MSACGEGRYRMENQDQLSDDQRQKMLQFMTTEHSALQAGRSATIFETGARAAAFLGTVSSALVALAFVGQVSTLGTAFFAFALVLLPTLFFVGLATFERALESSIEDTIYARGISRIHHLYVEMVPQAERYFVGSIHDDLATTMASTRGEAEGAPAPARGRLNSVIVGSFLTTAGAIAVVNSVIVGSFVGLLIRAVVVDSLALSVGVGIVVFLVSVFLHQRHQLARLHQTEQRLPALFPSERTP